METMSSIIKTARAASGLTQSQLAKELGVTGAYIARLEKGGVTPSTGFIEKLSCVLQIDLMDLFLASLLESNMPGSLYDALGKLRFDLQIMKKQPQIKTLLDDLLNIADDLRTPVLEICEKTVHLVSHPLQNNAGLTNGSPLQ